MRNYIVSAIVWTAFVGLLLSGLSAQPGTGRIEGIVKDEVGAVLPGVTVTVSGTAISPRMTTSNARGEFSFSGLPPGDYTLMSALVGFTSASAKVTVRNGATEKVSLAMTVGALTETVTVPASPAVNAQAASRTDFFGRARGGYLPKSIAPYGFNTEAYDKIDDNQWTEVGRKPLSTFSIDVDTASYSNIRRFLMQAQVPPKDAVRLEELINYFSYDYSEPRDNAPFAITTAIDSAPWNPRHRLALIGLQARKIDSSRLPPRNLVFLIDVSGSMTDANKLPLVKGSLAMLAPNLTEKDRVAIVVYAGAAGLVLPSTSGSDTPTILEALNRLEAGGSTNGAQGIQLAYKVAQDHFVKGGVNRVLLATDGDFNVGVTNQGDLTRLIEEKRDTGISLSVLGFGMGNLKDSTMEKLADKGNGNYFYIDSLSEAQKVLVEQAGGTLVTVAKDVKLQVEFNPRTVAAYRLLGYENRLLQDQDFNDDRKDAGDMGAGHSVTALYELIPAGEKIDIPSIDPLKYQQTAPMSSDARLDETMTVKVRYKQPEAATSNLMSVSVPTRTAMTPELGFASAVTEFAMLLRGSEFKGSSSFAQARELATKFKGADAHGHRAEFIRLIDAADGMRHLLAAQNR
jgi:Ca-activated chloride channel family protein